VTDVDDKIIDRAHRDGVTIAEITARYLKSYHADLESMGIQEPTFEPKATDRESMTRMLKIIAALIETEKAYTAGGNVYFDVKRFAGYGKLSHQKTDQMLENWRGEAGEGKKNHLDFALWKKSKADEPAWDSPWGKGRPGWHIECSAMSTFYLGETFDIHGGGKDLLFPHHENEKAQSEACFGKDFAKVWIHHGLVTTDSKKMSKSLKNFVTVNEIFEKYPVDVLKLFFLQSHYSQDVDFTWPKMDSVYESLKGFLVLFEKTDLAESRELPRSARFSQEFASCMQDDFNTPGALAVMFAALRDANKLLSEGRSDQAVEIAGWIKSAGQTLGLFEKLRSSGDSTKALTALIQLRNEKRKAKQFKVSDFIRDEVTKLGIHIEDQTVDSQVMTLGVVPGPGFKEKLLEILKKAEAMS
jgi:cysteinyl-tRNA synthetase